MSSSESKLNLTENDELSRTNECTEKTSLIAKMKKHFSIEFDGFFYVVLSVIILAISLTIGLILSIFFGPLQIQPHAGVSTDVKECSDIALKICKKGGNAVDASIGALMCLSVVRPDIVGLGGCGSMLVHNHTTLKSEVIDFSCVAPPDAKNQPIKDGYGIKESVAIPGVLSGLKIAHGKYGKLSWKGIMDFVMSGLEKGVKVTDHMVKARESTIFTKLPKNFRKLYENWISKPLFKPLDGELKDLLLTLQKEGPESGLNGTIAEDIISTGFSWKGSFNHARTQKPLKTLFGDYILMGPPLPSKGSVEIAIAYEILDKLLPKVSIDKENVQYYHFLLESMKLSQAITSFLGDKMTGMELKILQPKYIAELVKLINKTQVNSPSFYGPYFEHSNVESGSGSEIAVLDSNNLYVSLSVNLGSKFGSGLASKSGRILLNDAMRLFTSTSAGKIQLTVGDQKWEVANKTIISNNNEPAPGKRPLHNLVPLLIYNVKRRCGVRFIVGGDKGVRAATGSLQMVMSAIYLDQGFCPSKDCLELNDAGVRPRLHVNQLTTNTTELPSVLYEKKFPTKFRIPLQKKYGHTNMREMKNIPNLNSIGKIQFQIVGYSDNRGEGSMVSF